MDQRQRTLSSPSNPPASASSPSNDPVTPRFSSTHRYIPPSPSTTHSSAYDGYAESPQLVPDDLSPTETSQSRDYQSKLSELPDSYSPRHLDYSPSSRHLPFPVQHPHAHTPPHLNLSSYNRSHDDLSYYGDAVSSRRYATYSGASATSYGSVSSNSSGRPQSAYSPNLGDDTLRLRPPMASVDDAWDPSDRYPPSRQLPLSIPMRTSSEWSQSSIGSANSATLSQLSDVEPSEYRDAPGSANTGPGTFHRSPSSHSNMRASLPEHFNAPGSRNPGPSASDSRINPSTSLSEHHDASHSANLWPGTSHISQLYPGHRRPGPLRSANISAKKAKMHECQICLKQFPRYDSNASYYHQLICMFMTSPSGLKTHMNTHNNLRRMLSISFRFCANKPKLIICSICMWVSRMHEDVRGTLQR